MKRCCRELRHKDALFVCLLGSLCPPSLPSIFSSLHESSPSLSNALRLSLVLPSQKGLDMKREEYEGLPGWKQVNLKKAKGLF